MGSTTAFIFALESLLHCVALGLLLHWRSNIPKTRYPLNYIPLFSSVIFTAGAVVMAISNSKEILLVGRLIVGAGIGNVQSFVHYRVSQQVWNTLRNVCERSEHRLQKKLYSAPKNCFLSLFCKLQAMKLEFFSNFAPIVLCSNLFSKLFEIGEKWL